MHRMLVDIRFTRFQETFSTPSRIGSKRALHWMKFKMFSLCNEMKEHSTCSSTRRFDIDKVYFSCATLERCDANMRRGWKSTSVSFKHFASLTFARVLVEGSDKRLQWRDSKISSQKRKGGSQKFTAIQKAIFKFSASFISKAARELHKRVAETRKTVFESEQNQKKH